VRQPQAVRKLLRLCRRDVPLLLREIALVTYNDATNIVACVALNFLQPLSDVLEGGWIRNIIDNCSNVRSSLCCTTYS
jgi:hypothetical protein